MEAEPEDLPVPDRLGYLFFLSRPMFWLYLAGPVLVGAAFGASTVWELFSPLSVGLFLYFLLPGNVMLYGVNDVFDSDVDEYNPKKDSKEVRYDGDRVVLAVIVASTLLGLVFLPFLPREGQLWLLVFYFLAVQYSAPPLRFKTKPLLDSLSNGLYVVPGVVAYVALAGEQPPMLAIAGGWLWTMAMHTFSAIPDVEADRDAGIRTTATVLGRGRTLVYCLVVWTASAVVLGVLSPPWGVLMALYPALVVVYLLRDVDVTAAYWYYPFVNSFVGMLITMAGLWRLVFG
ncbi:MAG: prenyltransferase [Halobacteriales archaeon]